MRQVILEVKAELYRLESLAVGNGISESGAPAEILDALDHVVLSLIDARQKIVALNTPQNTGQTV